MKEVIMRVASFSADYPKAPIYVADLVRCKECKRRYRSGYRGDEYWVCDFMDAKIKDEDFCSYGEREGK